MRKLNGGKGKKELSAKIRRLVVGVGTTKRPSESEEWVKRYYEIELEIPEAFTQESFEETRVKVEAMILQWLQFPEVEAAKIPQIDIAEINSLTWMSYKTKEPTTRPDEPAWTFTDASRHAPEKQKIVKQLAEAVEKAPKNKLELGNMLYTFSGPPEDKKLFISRRPLTEKR
jgi:hypothetical protein